MIWVVASGCASGTSGRRPTRCIANHSGKNHTEVRVSGSRGSVSAAIFSDRRHGPLPRTADVDIARAGAYRAHSFYLTSITQITTARRRREPLAPGSRAASLLRTDSCRRRTRTPRPIAIAAFKLAAPRARSVGCRAGRRWGPTRFAGPLLLPQHGKCPAQRRERDSDHAVEWCIHFQD